MPDDLLSLEPEPEDFAATFDPPSPDMPSVAAKEEIVFPEESKLAFEGLFYIGMLRSTPTWAGHSSAPSPPTRSLRWGSWRPGGETPQRSPGPTAPLS